MRWTSAAFVIALVLAAGCSGRPETPVGHVGWEWGEPVGRLVSSIRPVKPLYREGETVHIEFRIMHRSAQVHWGAGGSGPVIFTDGNQVVVTAFEIRLPNGETFTHGRSDTWSERDYAEFVEVEYNIEWPLSRKQLRENSMTTTLHPGHIWGCTFRLNPFECPPGGIDGRTRFGAVGIDYYFLPSRSWALVPGKYEITAIRRFSRRTLRSNTARFEIVPKQSENT